MTAKERRELERLKTRNEQLESSLAQAYRVYADLSLENVNLAIALETVRELLSEAVGIMDSLRIS